MSVISVANLSVVKRDRLLFENLNFAVEQGSLLYVKGQNGAGKTSMLRVLAGLVEADSGEVYFALQNIKDCREHYHQNLVYFGHKLGINSTLSAVENLQYWCQQHEVVISVDAIFYTLAQLNLVGLEDIPVANLVHTFRKWLERILGRLPFGVWRAQACAREAAAPLATHIVV